MSVQSGEMLGLTPFPQTGRAASVPFPDGAYRANLYVYDPHGRIEWYALVPQSFFNGRYFTVGRGDDCNITLADGSVSTRHACVMANGGQLVLRDLNSTNGTYVNDQRIQEQILHHGDVVRIGATDVRFLYSYRDSPVRLVLEFVSGTNAGRVVAANSASTNIGRLNCAINLQGPRVAPQHTRVDAFGKELLFVVSLNKDHETFLNGQRVSGIAPARQGDILRIGDHEVVLRVVDAEAVQRGVPKQDGTLIMPEALPDRPSADNVAVVSAGELARLEAHIQDMTPPEDPTSMELPAFASPTMPARIEATGPATIPRTMPKTVATPAAKPTRAARPRRWLRWLALPILLGAALGVANFISLPQDLRLTGEVVPGGEVTLVAPARGRAENLYFRAGEQVVAGDVVANIIDLSAQAEIDRIDGEIAGLETQATPAAKRVVRKPSAADARALELAQSAAAGAKSRVQSVEAAFNRREVPFDALEAARASLNEAERRVASLEAELRRGGTQVVTDAPDDSVLAQIAALIARKEALAKRLRVPVRAPASGLLVGVGAAPLQVGALLTESQPLYRVVDTAQVILRMDVPPDQLGAVEGATASVELEGFPGQPVTVTLGAAAPVAQDGVFPLTTVVDNAAGRFRPGQKVTATIERPPISALAWARARLTE